jgi:hypothetical protein
MTAIGFLLLLIGFMGANASNNLSNVPDWVEIIFVAIFVAGGLMLVSGLFILMWMYLP